jgi:hypothetical protein
MATKPAKAMKARVPQAAGRAKTRVRGSVGDLSYGTVAVSVHPIPTGCAVGESRNVTIAGQWSGGVPVDIANVISLMENVVIGRETYSLALPPRPSGVRIPPVPAGGAIEVVLTRVS